MLQGMPFAFARENFNIYASSAERFNVPIRHKRYSSVMSELPDPSLEDVIAAFASLTGDAVSIGYREPGDYEARMYWVNDAQVEMFGYSEEETLGQYVSFFLDPEARDDLIAIVKPQFDAGKRLVQGETFALTKSGERLWISLLVVTTPTKKGRYSTAICRDITVLKNREIAAERALDENKKLLKSAKADRVRLVSAIDAINDLLVIWDKNQRLVRCNKQYENFVLGRPGVPGEPYRNVLEDIVRHGTIDLEPGSEEDWLAKMENMLRTNQPFPEFQVLGGRVFRISQSFAPNGDRVFVRTDITELQNQQSELEEKNRALEDARQEADSRALRDELTGLGNRRLVSKAMAQLSQWRVESGGHIVAFHIDLDRFKQINDTMGHSAGDAVLVEVARRLIRILETDDTLARIGGDEFLVLRGEPAGQDTRDAFAAAAQNALAPPVSFEGKEVRFGASIGIASTEVSSEDSLATDSDIALYKAKSLGRSMACRFERADFDAMEAAKRTSDDILRAIENREFEPHFQMQVDPTGTHIVGFEALARWHHPKNGVLGPYAFLSLGEDLGVLDQIDTMIFDKSLEYFGNAPRRYDHSLSFNVSNSRLHSTSLREAARVAQGFDGIIAFELLESILLDELDDAAALQLDMLREAGILIEIDDFGSGHASIIALDQVEPDAIKIDGRLVMAMERSKKSKRMVKSIVELAHALELPVTAEGVETLELARCLEEFGVDRLQGFHFGRPVPFQEVQAFLNTKGLLQTG